MIRACIFDLDGTLVNSLPSIAHFANFALLEHGLTPFSQEEYLSMIGWGADHLVSQMLLRQPVPDDNTALHTAVYRTYQTAYNAAPTYLLAPYAGIGAMLDALDAAGIYAGIVSNKPHETTSLIAKALFPALLPYTFGAQNGTPKKPDPAAVYHCMEKMQVKKQECLYIGDSEVDVLTGKNAGLTTLSVLWGFRDKKTLVETGGTRFFDSPMELGEYILSC